MRIFSGVKPSGELHIGNYLGAIKQWVKLQEGNEVIFAVVDEHAITTPQKPEELKRRTLEIAMLYLASGLNSKKVTIMLQSLVPAHAELGWILNTFTPLGELQRMTQFKDAVRKGKTAFAGLLNYPTLMASDILLYRTEGVPVGEDQIQHIELTRYIAERFNNKYGETFTIPKALLMKEGARIMSLDNPSKKMAKSEESPDGSISLADSPEEITRKIKKAVTDSGSEIKYDPATRPAVSNLINIYSGFSGIRTEEIENRFKGKGYAEFKKNLSEIIIKELEPVRKKYLKLKSNPEKIIKLLKAGSKKAAKLAAPTLQEVKRKIGFVL